MVIMLQLRNTKATFRVGTGSNEMTGDPGSGVVPTMNYETLLSDKKKNRLKPVET